MTKKSPVLMVLISLTVLFVCMLIPFSSPQADIVGLLIQPDMSGNIFKQPDVAYDTFKDRYIVVYERKDGVFEEIYFTIHNADGSIYMAPQNLSNHPPQPDLQPAVTYQPLTRQYLVVWKYGTVAGSDIYGQLVNDEGVLVSAQIPIATSANVEEQPDVAADLSPTGQYMVGYLQRKPGGGAIDLMRQVANNGLPTGLPKELFDNAAVGPRIAYGKAGTPANFFLTSAIVVPQKVIVRKVTSFTPGNTKTLTTSAVSGPGLAAWLAFNETFNKWLVVWAALDATALRGSYVFPLLVVNPPGEITIVSTPGVTIKGADVAAGYDENSKGRYNVVYASKVNVSSTPMDGAAVSDPSDIIYNMTSPNTRPAIAYNKNTKEFFIVWENDSMVPSVIYGQRHEIP